MACCRQVAGSPPGIDIEGAGHLSTAGDRSSHLSISRTQGCARRDCRTRESLGCTLQLLKWSLKCANLLQRAREAETEIGALQSKFQTLDAIPNVPTMTELNSVDTIQSHLRIISECVHRLIL